LVDCPLGHLEKEEKMHFKKIFLLFVVFLAACASPSALSAPTATFTPQPASTATFTPEPAATFTPTASPTPYVPFTVKTAVDQVNIRTNPGYLFTVMTVVRLGTELTVLGRCPGGEWLNIRLSDGSIGWVFHMLLQTEQDLQSVPIIQPQNVLLVTGKVIDSSGVPVNGIVFNVMQGAGTDAAVTNARTDSTGSFYAFLPMGSAGDWQVNYAAIGCDSNRMDNDCNCLNGVCGSPDPTSQTVTLPQSQSLVFAWK